MEIRRMDHIVLTTRDVAKCIDFWGRVLGLPIEERDGRRAIRLSDTAKINIHARPGEFLPAAQEPVPGALELCLETSEPLESVMERVTASGWPILLGPVERHGVRGRMQSTYLRDPDGNLVEICRCD